VGRAGSANRACALSVECEPLSLTAADASLLRRSSSTSKLTSAEVSPPPTTVAPPPPCSVAVSPAATPAGCCLRCFAAAMRASRFCLAASRCSRTLAFF
jgi:hypothetical protein